MKTCPKCGAVEEMRDTAHDYRIFECGTSSLNGGVFDESDHCTRRQRDALEIELAAAQKRIAELERELTDAKTWADSDQKLPEDDAIMAAHPVGSKVTNADTVYLEAIRLVSAKRSKYALVDLVNWLLTRILLLEANQCEAEPAWTQKIIENIGDNPTIRYEQLYRKAKR